MIWPAVPLDKLCSRIGTHDPRRQPNGPITYIDLSAIDQSKKQITGASQIIGADAPSRARQLLSAGDVLVSTVRPNLNAVAVVDEYLDGATGSTGFSVLRPSRDELDGRYLFQWVKSPGFIDAMVAQATGASYPAVSNKIVRSSAIPLPPLPEQRRIAAILDHADGLRAKRRGTVLRLDELAQSIFIDMFGDPEQNAENFPIEPLRMVVRPDDKINYGVVQPGPDDPNGVPLVRAGDLEGGLIRGTKLRRVARAVDERHRRSRLVGDEILIGCVGSIGSIALADESAVGFNIARAVARVRPGARVKREYLAAYLRTPAIQDYFASELRTVAQPTLNIKQIEETRVIVPPVERQNEFVHALRETQFSKGHALSQQKAIDALFACLQYRAFRGEL